MKELHVTPDEIGALNRIVEDSYANADEEDENEREIRDLLTSLLNKLEQAFSP